MPAPDVSVVVPFYNQERHLEECLLSIRNQTYRSWKCLLVDDGSSCIIPAGARKILEDDRFRLIKHGRNKGPAAARNTGFAACRSPYVVSVDSDDKIDSEFLKKTMDRFVRNPSIDSVFVHFRLFGSEDKVLAWKVPTIGSMLEGSSLPGSGVLLKRALWERAGKYCEANELTIGMEDWEFWLRCFKAGMHATVIHEPLYFYRRYPTSAVERLRYNTHLVRRFTFDRHRDLFDCYGCGRKFLADGYQTSSDESLRLGHRRRALMLALKAFIIRPDNLRLRLMAHALLPIVFARAIKNLKNITRDNHNSSRPATRDHHE